MQVEGVQRDFARVAASFAQFHARFAPLFGRTEARARSEQYLRGLLVQDRDRRNAENMAEAVPGASARALQRFLTEAPWSHEAVIEALQAYLGERLRAPDGVLVVDETSFPKKGDRSVGVARQYCGTLGKTANCQVAVFLAYVSSHGQALMDFALHLPKVWTEDPARCRAAEVPPEVGFQTKPQQALALLERARAVGQLTSEWVTADEGYGKSTPFRDALAADGWRYVLEVPVHTPVFPTPVRVEAPTWSGQGRPPTRPRLAAGEPGPEPVQAVAAWLGPEDWQALTVAEGAQGPRRYRFAARRVYESEGGLPTREAWLLIRENLDGSERKFYLSNAPADTSLQTLAEVASKRWAIEVEFETAKQDCGLDEYEVRSWPGWHHHIAMVLLADAFLLTLQQDWGKKDARADAAAGLSGRARAAATQAIHGPGPGSLADRDPAA